MLISKRLPKAGHTTLEAEVNWHGFVGSANEAGMLFKRLDGSTKDALLFPEGPAPASQIQRDQLLHPLPALKPPNSRHSVTMESRHKAGFSVRLIGKSVLYVVFVHMQT